MTLANLHAFSSLSLDVLCADDWLSTSDSLGFVSSGCRF
jgi:hypothetical protein